MECLHTLLLGAYKYMFAHLMSSLSADEKKQVSAYIDAFPSSGMNIKLNRKAPT